MYIIMCASHCCRVPQPSSPPRIILYKLYSREVHVPSTDDTNLYNVITVSTDVYRQRGH